LEITPPVPAIEPATCPVKALGAKPFIKTVGRTGGFPEEQHRGDSMFHEPTRDRAEKAPPETLTLDTLEHVDFVEFASESGHAAIVWCSLRKGQQLATIILDDVTKPTTVP
jgi:hypothetical protein